MSKNLKRITMFLVAVIGLCFYGSAASAASDAHCAASWAQIKSTKSVSVVRNFLKPCGASAVAANARKLLEKLQTPPKTVAGEKPVRRPRVIETIIVSQDMTGQQLVSVASRLKNRNEHSRARTAYEYACQKDHGEGCYFLARTYRDTNFGPVENKKYLEFLKKSCEAMDNSDNNKKVNCLNYARDVVSENIGTPNFEAAKFAYERACAFNDPGSCRESGVMYSNEKFGTKDSMKYKIYVEKSCKLKLARGCDSARLRSVYVDNDLSSGKIFFDFSLDYEKDLVPFCENGYHTDCVKFADFYTSDSVAKTVSRKLKLYDSACKAKLEEACEKAKKLRNPDIFKSS